MSKILIETVNLNKTYKHVNGNITLFNNLNLKVKEGDLVALVHLDLENHHYFIY